MIRRFQSENSSLKKPHRINTLVRNHCGHFCRFMHWYQVKNSKPFPPRHTSPRLSVRVDFSASGIAWTFPETGLSTEGLPSASGASQPGRRTSTPLRVGPSVLNSTPAVRARAYIRKQKRRSASSMRSTWYRASSGEIGRQLEPSQRLHFKG
jgi:hypothetical protein